MNEFDFDFYPLIEGGEKLNKYIYSTVSIENHLKWLIVLMYQ